MREREVENYLVRKLESIGLPVHKFVPDQDPGMPDRVVLLPESRVLWIETKKPKGGRVAKLQKYRHKKLEEAGHDVVICWTKEQADLIVEKLSDSLQKV